MKWHKGTSLPNIDTDTALCVVQYKYSIPDYKTDDCLKSHYEVMLFHKNTQSFAKPEDIKGVNGLRNDLVIRWAYVEENDDIYEEQEALTAIYAAIQHVRTLFDCLLTDGICCGKEYHDLIGLNELDSLQEKVSKRILYLDNL